MPSKREEEAVGAHVSEIWLACETPYGLLCAPTTSPLIQKILIRSLSKMYPNKTTKKMKILFSARVNASRKNPVTVRKQTLKPNEGKHAITGQSSS